ncbi:nucleotide disphospho-sugar-binding domain-containing protein [Micromonospora matsumotoense]|uniref:nucleotide disphospho-sugar-binding domain-containing protein n=1 Tax=Micromonospora matsumotoense TaxID=121616 RepID=UPI0034080CAC
MRVLFVPHANKAHLHIMTPLAWALRTAGHDVRVASQPEIADAIIASGFVPVEVGRTRTEMPAFYPGVRPGEAPPVVMAPGERQKMPLQQDFPRDNPLEKLSRASWGFALFSTDEMIADLIALIDSWRPDLVVWDSMVYAAPAAATVCGVPHARMMMGPDGITQLRRAARDEGDPLRDWLDRVLGGYGARFDEDVATGHFTIDPMPPWQYQPDGLHLVPVRHIAVNPPARIPDWLREEQQRPRVCLTLGESHRNGRGTEAPAADLLDAVSGLDAEVIATFNAKQLATIPVLPDNVRVVDFVPLAMLLPSCAAIVHHGGAGTFATAVEHAVPQLIIPGTHWGFQWWGPLAHANGLQQQGAGRFVADADHLTSEALAEDLARVLKDPSFKANAERLRTQVAGLPTPNDLVPALHRLVDQYRDVAAARAGRPS